MVLRFFRIVTKSVTRPVAPDPDAAPPDRRRSPRLSFYAHCGSYDPIRFQSRPRSKLINVGIEGVALETPYLTGQGDELMLNFTVGSQAFASAKAVIMWSRPHNGGSCSGLQFADRSLGRRVRRALIKQIKAIQT